MRVAIVGLGTACRTLHLPALRGIPGVTVVGGCDPVPAQRAEAESRWGIPCHPSLDEMLDRARPDVVVIGTPPDLHAEQCLTSLRRGAHVICEKPFVSSVAEADAVLQGARDAGRGLGLNHEFREMPIFAALRRAVGTPEVGKLRVVQVWQNMDLPPWKEPGWRGQMLQRTLYEAGVHLIDFLMALFGERPHAVSATVSSCGAHPSQSDAVALTTLEFSGGRLAHVVQNRLCPGETQYFEVRADAEHSSLRASFGGRARLLAGLFRSTTPRLRVEWGASGMAWRERGTRRTPLARNPREPGAYATRVILEQTLRAFREGTTPPVPGSAGRDTLLVIASCYRAAERGERVTIGDEPGPDIAEFRMGAAPVPLPQGSTA
jgi:predicted dehydrogenase